MLSNSVILLLSSSSGIPTHPSIRAPRKVCQVTALFFKRRPVFILVVRIARDEDVVEKVEDEEAIGSLSFNENDEARGALPPLPLSQAECENLQIRYHNESSGMPLLDKLADNTSGRNSGGIWQVRELL